MKITKTFRFEAAHVLPGHRGKCCRLHGHSYVLDVTLLGPVLQEGASGGMVLDFGDLSDIVASQVIARWDHRVLSARGAEPQVRALIGAGFASDVVVVDVSRTTAELLAGCIRSTLEQALQSAGYTRVVVDSVTLWETATGRAVS